MFGFGKPPKISDEKQEWVREAIEWAKKHEFLHERTQLVTLSKEFFKAPSGRTPMVAKALIADILAQLPAYAHLVDHLDVLPIDQLDAEYRYDPTSSSQTAGTFSMQEDGFLIRYNADDFERPAVLINTLVHEAMHMCCHSRPMEFPGGFEAEELCTDFACIASGFGALALNAADQAGWTGYMRQETRAFALAKVLDEIGFIGDLAEINNNRLRRWVLAYRAT